MSMSFPKIGNLTQGVGTMDAIAAGAGLAAATMIPGLIIKDTSSTSGKLLKLAVAFGSAAVAGIAFKSLAGSKAGQMAVVGGLAGMAVQAVGAYTPIKVGTPSRIGDPLTIAPSMTRDKETVQLIRP